MTAPTFLRRRAALLLLTLSLLAAAVWAERRWLAVEKVSVVGGGAAARAAANELLRPLLGAGFLTLDLVALQRRLRALPGVAAARARRTLPGALNIELEAHQPLARWGGGGLVDIAGERYVGGDVAAADLPIFKGGDERAKEMADFYGDVAADMAGVGGVAQLALSPGGDWTVFLRNGMVLYLGREAPRRRLALYARHAAVLRERFADMRAVDLRYERGFAVVNGGGDKEER